MEQQNERRYKGKRLRKRRVVLTIFVLACLAIGAYGFMQFRSGLDLASDSKPPEPELFVPDEKEDETVNYLLLGVDSRGEEQ